MSLMIDTSTSRSRSQSGRTGGDTRPSSKRPKRIYAQSPTTGDKAYITASDIDSSRNLIPDAPSEPVLQPIESPSKVYIPSGLHYTTPLPPALHLPARKSPAFTVVSSMRQKLIFQTTNSLISGLSLLTLILLPTSPFSAPLVPSATCSNVTLGDLKGFYPYPTISCLLGPSTSFNVTTSGVDTGLFSFLLFYSPSAMAVNFTFQILSIVTLIGCLDRFTKIRTPHTSVTLLFSVISFISIILLIPIDMNLTLSQGSSPSYGLYGNQNWFFNGAVLASAGVRGDMEAWRLLNTLRGSFGILTFLAWSSYKKIPKVVPQ